jgi:hypothetical protein
LDKKCLVIIIAFSLLLTFATAFSYANYQAVKSLEEAFENLKDKETIINQPTAAPAMTMPEPSAPGTTTFNPPPTPETQQTSISKNASKDQYGNSNYLFYALEFNLISGLQETDFQNNPLLNYSSKLYYYRTVPQVDGSVWVQAIYTSPISSEQKTAASALSDYHGIQTYTWYINDFAIIDLQRSAERGGLMILYYNKDTVLPPLLPNYGEAVQW